MKLVAIETATQASSIALGNGRDVVASAERVDRRGHGGFLVSALDFCFDQAGWQPADVDAVIVDVGPGLFTGLRVGLATAHGIAATMGVPLVPVVSLDALAVRAATGRRRIWSVVDVRRGEVAIASYQPVPGGVVKDDSAEIVSPSRLRTLLEGDPDDSLVVGDWSCLDDSVLRGLYRVKTGRPRFPSAEAVLELGALRAEKEDYPLPDEVRPMYLREPNVQISWATIRGEGPWAGE